MWLVKKARENSDRLYIARKAFFSKIQPYVVNLVKLGSYRVEDEIKALKSAYCEMKVF